MSATLITGGTGFLGSALIARLLEEDDGPDLLLPVRAPDAAGAAARVDELLARLYDVAPPGARRLRPLRAELTAPGLGLSAADRRLVVSEATRVVHCAASISFTLPLAEARAINVGGTRAVLDLARELDRVERVVHVSTAYVAGRSRGRFGEDDLDVGQGFRNTYERTKAEAERVLAAAADLPIAVVRPSIVVGESDSGWTSAFNVVYWPLQAFARGLLDAVAADPAGIVDLVGVDHVVDVLAEALRADGASGTFHAVAGDRALRVADLVERACAILGRPPPRLLAPAAPDPADPAAVFAAYFDVQVAFDDRRARALVGERPEADLLAPMLRYARETRWGKRPLSRQAARERMALAA
ncbi:MAG: Male sterility domain protein [Solirubrobacterales bacterium]|nr:Male sterility domain protein [Solirubrobacterales bacterium]